MLNYQRVNHLSTVNHHSITIPKSRKGASAAWATKVGPPGLKPAACGGKKAAMLAVNSLELSMGNTMGKYHPFQTWTMMWKLYLLDLRKTMVSLGVVFFWDWITWDKTMDKTMDSMDILWGYGMGSRVVTPSWIQRNPATSLTFGGPLGFVKEHVGEYTKKPLG